MRHNLIPSLFSIVLLVLGLYALPSLLFTYYASQQLSTDQRWLIFSLGLLIAIAGTALLLTMLSRWSEGLRQYLKKEERQIKQTLHSLTEKTVSQPIVNEDQTYKLQLEEKISEWQAIQTQLNQDIADKDFALQTLSQEQETYQLKILSLSKEFANYKNQNEQQIEQQNSVISECQKTISELRMSIDKHLQHIANLETKERDLHYEIKALLQYTTIDNIPEQTEEPKKAVPTSSKKAEALFMSASNVNSPQSASLQLKRCIDIAMKITGSHHIGNHSMRSELPVDNHALDFRRLCDSLRVENGSIVVLYSQKEHKLLFANNRVKDVLGWTPEKFTQSFQEILLNGQEEWKKGLGQLTIQSEARFPVNIKNKSGSDQTMQCHLGIVNAGVFRHHIVGVMYP